eukprot:4537224-Pyramimonas_sp.AAC.1
MAYVEDPWSEAAIARERARAHAAQELGRCLVDMYAGSKTMTANHLCKIAWLATRAGAHSDFLG